MKLVFVSLLLLVGISFNSVAQENLELGLLGGFNVSNVIGSDVNGNNVRVAIHLGGYAHIPFQDKIGFRGELQVLSLKGTASGRFRTTYIDAPLMVTYNLDEKFQALAGIQPSILLNARVSDGTGRGAITDDIRRIDFGFVFGGWYQFTEELGFGARIVPGILRVGDDGNERTYNINFQLSVGYRFL